MVYTGYFTTFYVIAKYEHFNELNLNEIANRQEVNKLLHKIHLRNYNIDV